MTSAEAAGEGSLNHLQDRNGNDNVNDTPEQNNDSFNSTTTVISGASTSTSTAIFSVSSETDLLIPGKLHNEIVNLKNCYVQIIDKIVPSNDPKSLENPSQVLMLSKEQMLAGINKRRAAGKEKFNAETAKNSLVDLLDCVRPLCLPFYQCDSNPKLPTVPKDNQISLLTERIESLSNQNKSNTEALTSQLESLKLTLSNFEGSLSNLNIPPATPPPPELISINPDHVLAVDHGLPPVSSYEDNFITDDECVELFDLLDTLSPYKKEKGRSTIKFGEKYSYNGSREDSIVEFPPLIQRILDKLNDGVSQADIPPLNSCLVTKYSGPNSYIPEHSDNERSIHPDSSIFTVSVGHDTTVKFRDVINGAVQEKVVKPGSLYVMSRASQDLFKHSIPKNQALAESDIRFSLTFRSLHWRNNNSTVIIGDSNTGGLKFSKFGRDAPSNLSGTFGNAMPGRRVPAFTVDQIDPLKCIGFNNIVVHCGINSIRGDDVVTEDHVKGVYVDFKTKINDIISVNKRARVYVDTLLPTKNVAVNKKVKVFNSLINDDLSNSFKDIRIINIHTKFANVSGVLSAGLSQEYNSRGELDQLHINAAGLRLFSSLMKNSLFSRKRMQERGTGGGAGGGTGSGSREQQNGRSFSSVVSNRGRHDRRRDGSRNHPRTS